MCSTSRSTPWWRVTAAESSLVDLIDNVVYLRMSGGCQGCGLADITLRHGVDAAIREAVPEIGRIHDLTNHAAGVMPYRAGGSSPFALKN